MLNGVVIEEKTHDRTLVSKPSWLRGVHVIGAVKAAKPQLVAVLPLGWSNFCGRLTSIGGDYSATVQFNADLANVQIYADSATSNPPVAELRFDTKFEFPDTATHETGGVVLEEGTCNSNAEPEGARRFIASFWNEAPVPKLEKRQLEIVLNMNVTRAERLQHQAFLGSNKLPVSCDKLTASDALAFNFRCSVFVPETLLPSTANTPVSFTYERFYRGRISKPRTAQIFLGADQ